MNDSGKEPKLSFELSESEKSDLLKLARRALEMHVTERKTPEFKTESKILQTKCGAFVTLHKNGDLRGCIGYIEAYKPLYQTIIEMAQAASTKDSRFEPVTAGELAEIDIELSVLSPLEKITDFSKIIIGVHGLLVRQGYYSGLLLPQVAVEWDMDTTVFLEETCRKAGLPRNAYKTGADVYYYSAQVFGEKTRTGA
ncbi:MAG TPA: AmmeMemoRadiSam system protein A [Candidatus Wallbacteria bacterium]|nr:AmmeMemoRadiSam system protein A [Candidatus Wallbacteria bacterium]